MEYTEIELLKQSEKSTVYLVREKEGEKIFVRKRLKGRREVYETLKNCTHAGLPKIYEVELSDEETTVIEEYIKGQPLGSEELTEQQLRKIVRQLCDVLGMLHGMGMIHRDLKPSNIILDEEEHVRLIDFDAARMPKDGMETDTRLLGTRGYAPPEQYGFAQTDVRTDIYALGVTLEQIFGDKAQKAHYRRVFQKCKRLDPKKRYQSVQQVERAFFHKNRGIWCGAAVPLLLVIVLCAYQKKQKHSDGQMSSPALSALEKDSDKSALLTVLPAPENPRWNGDTGIALWDAVPNADSSEYGYHWELYWAESAVLPDLDNAVSVQQGDMMWNSYFVEETSTYQVSVAKNFQKNGYYFFTVSANGDGIQYADSPYVLSDAFKYTGESAPSLPNPTGLEWKVLEIGEQGGLNRYAAWGNLDSYEDADSFNIRVFNASGEFVGNNIWTKAQILSIGQGGVWIDPQMLTKEGSPYRFTVQVYSSRPNEYQSTVMPDPVPEEYFSPWYDVNPERFAAE